jgi:tetratricopeptide (TPR) repeat protein
VKRLAALFLVAFGLSVASSALAADSKPADAKANPVPATVDSVGLLERMVAKDSTKFDNLYRLGIMYLDRERMAEASRVFLKANQVKPNDLKVLVNLGVAADALGHAEEAQGFYAQALKAAPGDSVAMCRMASSKYAQGKYDESMGMLRELVANKPRAHCAYFTMGVAFADAGLYRDAIRMWHKVVDLAPESPEAMSAKESIDVLEKFLQGK